MKAQRSRNINISTLRFAIYRLPNINETVNENTFNFEET